MSDLINSNAPIDQGPKPPVIALAAGGTGGHIFPACALARNLIGKGYRVILITDRRGEKYVDKMPDIAYEAISTSRIYKHPIKIFKTAWGNICGYWQSRRLLKKQLPGIIVGFGGYPSFPPMLAAKHMNIPIIIHEQNALLGKANRVLAGYADGIALTFRETRRMPGQTIDKSFVTGNPVRQDMIGIGARPYEPPKSNSSEPVRLLVVGGSQGSRIFSDVIPVAISLLPVETQKRLIITQQCRREDLTRVRSAYQRLPAKVTLEDFIQDMPQHIKESHIIITRAGASTVAELTVAGRPAIYVPLAASKEGDQYQNAMQIAEHYAGLVMKENDFTPEELRLQLMHALNDPEALTQMAQNAKRLGFPDATEKLAEHVTRYLSESRGDQLPESEDYNLSIRANKATDQSGNNQ